jgi:hypothetical protein
MVSNLLEMYYGIEVATSLDAVFYLHNFILNGNLVIYGGGVSKGGKSNDLSKKSNDLSKILQ